MSYLPFVSVILPIRNEEKYIKATLKTIALQDYPSDKMEILISDGMSDDGTRQLVSLFCENHPELAVKVMDNPEKTVPFGLNRAIKFAKGEVIVRMDAHSVYPISYISRLVDALFANDVHNCGGIVKTLPACNSVKCKAIALALSHPLGVGNSYFRIGSKEPRFVDTVPFGCFRREVFDKIGHFDEQLVRNQDDEFNGRMIKHSYRILLVPDVVTEYYARDRFSRLFKMYYQYGLYKPLAVYKLAGIPTIRQLVPLGFVLFLLMGFVFSLIFAPVIWAYLTVFAVYVGALAIVSVRESFKQKCFFPFHLTASFFILHLAYGWGYLVGLSSLLIGRSQIFSKSTISR